MNTAVIENTRNAETITKEIMIENVLELKKNLSMNTKGSIQQQFLRKQNV